MHSVTLKMILLAASLLAFVCPAFSADINITVNGRVEARPCTVSTTDVDVDLGDLYTFSFVAPGSVSAWHDATLNLTNCPTGTSRVTATFSGPTDETGYYRNSGTAKNIQIELQDDRGARFNNGSNKPLQLPANSRNIRFPLQVRALSVNGGATQGSIQAVISVTYTYS